LGANGLLYRSFKNKPDEWRFLPALHIDNAIDTAGAGDWCSAGIIHTLYENIGTSILATLTITQLEQVLVFGQFLSAINCNFYGARGLMYNLSYEEIAKLYSTYKKEKKIELKKKESGFTMNKTPFDFSKLL
jgi:fructokinase